MAIWAAILWGVSGVVGQFLFQRKQLNAEWLVTVRMLAAGVLLLAYSGWRKPSSLFSVWTERSSGLDIILFGIFGMLAVQYTYFAAIAASNAATATVLQYLGPVFIAGYYALKERRLPSWIEAAALGLAMAGTFLLVTHGKITELAISGTALSWGLASAVALAFYSIQPIGLLKKHDTAVVIGWGMVLGGTVLSVYSRPWKVEGVWDLQAYMALGFIVAFGTLIAFYAYLSAVKLVGAKVTSLLACAEPLSAALVAVMWLGIGFGLSDWLGSFLIVGAIAILALPER